MLHLIVQTSKYLMIILFLLYTFECFNVFRFQHNQERQEKIYRLQRRLMFFIHLIGYAVLWLTCEDNTEILGLYLMEAVIFLALYLVYHRFYRHSSELVLNNMCMLLCIGMIIMARLNIAKAMRQFMFIAVGACCAMIIPLILENISFFRKLGILYALIGIGALALVLVKGATTYGAKLSISIHGISLQPSEFVKILFVFFIAAMLYKRHDFTQVFITGIISAVFVLILIASNDLGGGLLYYFTFLVMVYVASQKLFYFVGGTAAMAVAAVGGYYFIGHVQTRVIAWRNPLADYASGGYQVCQSLFAIGTGGWFGLGLNQGDPSKIPVVENDFVFAAIAEEMGGVFALCLILVCVSCFLMIFNVSLQMKDTFYKLVALGLGSTYALQVFLTMGGVTKFIPSTGVTLPLISYGGSSLLSTMLLFGIIQGLYIRQHDERPHRKRRKEPAEADNGSEPDENEGASDGKKRKRKKAEE